MKSTSESLPVPPIILSARMRQVERREWWLWLFVVVVTLVLTVGIASLAFSLTKATIDDAYSLDIRQSVWGLLGLILLFDIYSLYQQFQIYSVRRQLLARDELFGVIAENIPDMIAVVDERGQRLYNSPAYTKILGYSAEELQQTPSLEQVHPDDRARVAAAAKHALNSGHGEMLEYRIQHKDGSWHFLESIAGVVPGAQGKAAQLIIVNRDITDRKRMEEQLQRSAFFDGLTGLPNRALFFDRLERAVNRAERSEQCHCAVLVVDIDDFKKCNDSLGHSAGDQMLIAISQRLTQSVRKYDLVSRCTSEEDIHSIVGSATLARVGGDEFTILLEDIHDAGDAIRAAKRIQQNLAASAFVINQQEMFVTGTVGIAMSSPSNNHAEDLLRDADIAMYRAKTAGIAGFELFDHAMHEVAVRRLDLETALRKAVQRSEFRVFYQPIVRLRDRTIVGFEGLGRWQRPGVGLLPPSEFIAAAEKSGLIIPMNRFLRLEACRKLRKWQTQFPTDPPLTLSLNVSASELAYPDLIKDIVQALQQTGLPPSSLQLEVLETVASQGGQPLRVLGDAKAVGVGISLDDFGSGYSCLSRLRSFPVDTLKIDRAFVARMDTDPDNRAIVHSILTLAHNFGLKVVAEGTETLEEVNALVAIGCEYAQGYYFYRPMDENQAMRLLETSHFAKH
jgi:PAS domain S-box-containing protein